MFSHLEPTSTCPSAPHKPFGWCSCLAPVHCKVLQGATNQQLKLDRPPAWWHASGLHLPPQRGPMHFHPEASWPLPSSYIGPPMSPRQNVQNGSGLVQLSKVGFGLPVRHVRSKALGCGTSCYAEPPVLWGGIQVQSPRSIAPAHKQLQIYLGGANFHLKPL